MPQGVLAIIPARGGSKGIPGKNIIPIAGKPLIAWSILAAKQSELIERVVVSTDDHNIANVSLEYGAEVIQRPAVISGDTASSESALLHCLETLKTNEDYFPDIIAFIQCTSPLTISADIDDCVKALISGNADSLLSVCSFHHFLWEIEQNGTPVGINHNSETRFRRQDVSPQFLENGAIYVMKTKGFIKAQHRFFGHTRLHVMPTERSWEVDSHQDLLIGECMLREQLKHRQAKLLPQSIGAIFFDFDGVFTDNKATVSEAGLESVTCDRSDGRCLSRLKRLGIPIYVISSEKNNGVNARCAKLGLPCRFGIDDKTTELNNILFELKIPLSSVVYVGNDINDVECLEMAGCGVVVNDAHSSAKKVAQIVLAAPGGKGAICELVDIIEKWRTI